MKDKIFLPGSGGKGFGCSLDLIGLAGASYAAQSQCHANGKESQFHFFAAPAAVVSVPDALKMACTAAPGLSPLGI